MKKYIFIAFLLITGFGQCPDYSKADSICVDCLPSSINGTSFTIIGPEATDASLILDADEGDDLADTWTIQSQASTNLLRFLNDTTLVLSLDSDQIFIPTGSTSGAGMAFQGNTNTGIFQDAANRVSITAGGTHALMIGDGFPQESDLVVRFPLNGIFCWAVGAANNSACDTKLFRDAAGTLALRNGTNAQEFRVYNTDNGANDEYATFGWAANLLSIGAVKTGTGTLRNVEIISAETVVGSIKADGTGKVVCIKADQSLGTCTDVVGVTGTCTCS